MLQRLRSARTIPRPDPLALPVTQLQHLRGLTQSQAARPYPSHHFHSAQLFLAQYRSPQSSSLLPGGTLKGDISNVVSWGHFQCGSTEVVVDWYSCEIAWGSKLESVALVSACERFQ